MGCGAIALLNNCVLLPMDRGGGPRPFERDDLAREAHLRRDVQMLAGEIGPRNTAHPSSLLLAESYIARELARAGLTPRWESFDSDRETVSNVSVEFIGADSASEIVIIGAHYDSVTLGDVTTPGADDNASGTAVVLQLARELADSRHRRTLRHVFFVNEEPPHFWKDTMGSLVHARGCKARGENIVAMLSVESVGYFQSAQGTQDYPPLIGTRYPSTGDFVALVGFSSAEGLVRRCERAFAQSCDLPVTGAALPSLVPRIGSSDHWSFWKQGYEALMVTDTAPHRNPNNHKPGDTPETLDYESMAKVVEGLIGVVHELAGTGEFTPTYRGEGYCNQAHVHPYNSARAR
jgi:hypothetical protein